MNLSKFNCRFLFFESLALLQNILRISMIPDPKSIIYTPFLPNVSRLKDLHYLIADETDKPL